MNWGAAVAGIGVIVLGAGIVRLIRKRKIK